MTFKKALFILPLLAPLVLVVLLILVPPPVLRKWDLERQATSVVALPKGAQVIAVDRVGVGGTETVSFRLPQDRPAEVWMKQVMAKNSRLGSHSVPPNVGHMEWAKFPHGRSLLVTLGNEYKKISYDQDTRLYRFEDIDL